METLIHQVPAVIFAFGEDYKITFVNDTLLSELGYEKDDLLGKPLETFLPVSSKLFFQTHFLPLLKLQGSAKEIFFFILNSKQEQIPLLINADELPTADGKWKMCCGMVVHYRKKFEEELISARTELEKVIQENTELKKARQELKKYSVELDESLLQVISHDQELAQLSKVLTHDLQEPIRKLFLFKDLLSTQMSDPPETRKRSLEKIDSSASRIRSIVAGLQEYAWLSERPVELSAVSVDSLLHEVIEQLSMNQRIRWINHNETPVVNSDRELLSRMFHLLLENRKLWGGYGDEQIIHLSTAQVTRNRYRHLSDRYDYLNYVKITFADSNGVPAQPQKIWVDLFQNLNLLPGTRLELVLCKKIAEKNHGFIEAHRTNKGGTLLDVFLPVATS